MNTFLIQLGWTEHEETFHQEQPQAQQLQPARISSDFGAQYNVWCADGVTRRAQLTGRLRNLREPLQRPAAGDWVETVFMDEHMVLITELIPRRTQLVRQAAGLKNKAQVIGANLDIVFIVTSMNMDFNPRRLERYLTTVHESKAIPMIILNKCDLVHDPERYVRLTKEIARDTSIICTSALNNLGTQTMREHMGPGKTAALIGSSGVGKSTLTNALLGAQVQTIQDIRSDDDEGRHTTTRRELFLLDKPGGLLLDTPGMRELQMWDASKGYSDVFQDIEALTTQCRFRNCTHIDEPGCAVLHALEHDELTEGRFRNWLKLQREIAYQRQKTDSAAAHRAKLEWKKISKSHRAYTTHSKKNSTH